MTRSEGRRVPDAPDGVGVVLKPCEYGRVGGVWHACAPNGLLANLAGHLVVEEPDGTITVAPSIDVTDGARRWHGYLERGRWEAAP